jgi:hypothetical protein
MGRRSDVVGPAPLAPAFIPALAGGSFVTDALLAVKAPSRSGQDVIVIPAFVVVGIVVVAVQLFHLWLVERTLRRDGN